MALTGAWRDAHLTDAGAKVWGTGINPVHLIPDGTGREIAVTPVDNQVPDNLTEQYWHHDSWDESVAYGETPRFDDSLDYPNWTTPTDKIRSEVQPDWPEWGNHAEGLPGGAAIRSVDHGARQNQTPNQVPSETVTNGWRNKVSGDITQSRESDISTILVRTSDVQLHKVRQGSQRGVGSASEYVAPIPSRIVGRIVKIWSQGQRTYDMEPREQIQRIRGWWPRNAGTGRVEWMNANEQIPTRPAVRALPALPDTGPTVGGDPTFGYTSEDMAYAY